jgi:hypothetical protein
LSQRPGGLRIFFLFGFKTHARRRCRLTQLDQFDRVALWQSCCGLFAKLENRSQTVYSREKAIEGVAAEGKDLIERFAFRSDVRHERRGRRNGYLRDDVLVPLGTSAGSLRYEIDWFAQSRDRSRRGINVGSLRRCIVPGCLRDDLRTHSEAADFPWGSGRKPRAL